VEVECLELGHSWGTPPLELLVVPLGPWVFWFRWLIHGPLWVGCLGYVCGLDGCFSGDKDLTSGHLG
jgi:hypothetical protein